jgi:hypothetical protein
MANVAVGDLYKHRIFCYSGNQVAINTRYFIPTLNSGAAVTEQQLITAMDIVHAAAYKPAMHNLAQYIGSDIQNIQVGPPYPIQIAASANTGNGTGGADPLPQQVSGIYTVTTDKTGRGFRGRAYIPFPSTAFVTIATPPLMSAAYQALLTSIANEFVGSVTIGVAGSSYDLNWCIRHSAPPALRGTTEETVSFKVGSNFATQRRRGDFGRTNTVPVP